MPTVISRKSSTGYPQVPTPKDTPTTPDPLDIVAKSEKRISIIKEYPRPAPKTLSYTDDKDRAKRVELQYLRSEVKRQKDKIRRLEREIIDEVQMLISVLNDGKQETYEQIKRRISRLKGSIEYLGREDSLFD
jgi:hypothetical protein